MQPAQRNQSIHGVQQAEEALPLFEWNTLLSQEWDNPIHELAQPRRRNKSQADGQEEPDANVDQILRWSEIRLLQIDQPAPLTAKSDQEIGLAGTERPGPLTMAEVVYVVKKGNSPSLNILGEGLGHPCEHVRS